MKKRLKFFAILLGNIFEHYDKVLYGLMAPYLAPLFFPKFDPLVQLILAYLPFGLISRPLGALFWGRMGDSYGLQKALHLTLMGSSIVTFATGFLPTYSQVGFLAPISLAIMRGIFPFFVAGENTGAPLLLLEGVKRKKRDLLSSVYEMSGMIGVLIASLAISILASMGKVEQLWRVLFFIGGITGLSGVWLRKGAPLRKKERATFHWRQYVLPFVAIIFVTALAVANYEVTLHMFNGFMPLISSISKEKMFWMHTLLSLIDLILLPIFGYLSSKWGKERIMLFASLAIFASALPAYYLLQIPNFSTIFMVRSLFVLLGLALSAPYQFWMQDVTPKENRFTTIAVARAIGAQAIGQMATPLSLTLYKKTGWIGAPALPLMTFSLLSFFSIWALRNRMKEKAFSVQS